MKGVIILIAFSILLLVPAGAQNAFAGLSEAPTCTAGFLYNTSTDMCEKTTTVAPTCPNGAPLNTSTDLCEGIITPPTCPADFHINQNGVCEIVICDQNGCDRIFAFPLCDTGIYNPSSVQCEIDGSSPASELCFGSTPFLNTMTDRCFGLPHCAPGEICTPNTSSPSCDPGLNYNPDSNQCDIVAIEPTCTTGNYNMVSNQCEATTTSTPTCPDGFTLNTFTDLCESPFEEDPGVPIGGTLIPIDSASLFLVGAQMTTSWLIPVIVSAVGIVLVFVRKSKNS